VRPFALDETVQDLRVYFCDMRKSDLVDLGALAAGGRGLVGEGHIEFPVARFVK